MLIIALTGGIGSGKSEVSRMFAQLGVPVIDTDVIARELVMPGQPAYQEILQQFGADLRLPDDSLNRRKLREIIFVAPEKRQLLEAILHPRIRQAVQAEIQALDAEYCIVVIPLLTEKGAYPFIDRVLVIDTDEQRQIERTMARDQQSRAAVEQILRAQASRSQRLSLADDVLENNDDLAALHRQVAQLDSKYRQLARTMQAGLQ